MARQIREQKELEKQQAMLATTGTIEGYITDAAGKGVAGVHVSASLAGEFLDGEKTTDETGHFKFTELDPGAYMLRILDSKGSWRKASPTFDVIAGSTYEKNVSVRVVHKAKGDGSGSGMQVGYGFGGAIAYVPYSLPLSQAVADDDVEKVKALLETGARVNGREPHFSNATPLFFAVEHGNIEIVSLLLRYGAKVNIRDDSKRTPLLSIDDDASPELIRLVVNAGASISAKDESGESVIFAAVETGRADMIAAVVSFRSEEHTSELQSH